MGDLRRAIDFGDSTIQIEALLTLYNDTINVLVKTNVDKINAKIVNNFPYMKFLEECICSSETLVVECSCRIIAKMIKENRMDEDFAINYLINLLPSAKSSCSAIFTTLSEIIAGFKLDQAKSMSNPFILIYHRKPNGLSSILNQIEKIFFTSDGENLFHFVKPFLTNLMLRPTSNEHFLITFDFILNALSSKNLQFLEYFLINSLSWMDSKFPCHPHTYLFFARQIWKLPCSFWTSSIPYIESFLTSNRCPVLAAQALAGLLSVYSSVQQASKLGYKFGESSNRIRICIRNLETLFDRPEDHDHSLCSNIKQSVFSGHEAEYELISMFCRRRRTVDDYILQYDASVADEFHVNLMTSLMMVEKSRANSILPLLCRSAAANPSLSMYLCYVILHHFSKNMTYDVIKFLPLLTTNLVCLPTVMRFVTGLMRNEALQNLGYAVLRDLYKKQPTVLFDQVKPYVVDVCRTEKRNLALEKLRLASVICEIGDVDCGVEMLGLLEKIINERKHSDDQELVTISIEATGHLCWNEVLDVNVAWKMLNEKLQKDDRASVVVSLIKFCQMVAKILNENEEDVKKTVLSSVLDFLWKNVASKSAELQMAALESLSEFDPILFESKHFQNIFKVSTPSVDAIESVDGRNLIKILDFIDQKCFHAFSIFLTNVIRREVDLIGRHVYFEGSRISSKNISSLFDDLPRIFVDKFLDKSTPADIKTDLSIPILLTYEITVDESPLLDDSRRKSLMTRGRQYVQIFKRLLVQTPADVDDWRRPLVLPVAWKRFMGILFHGCLGARRSELETTPGKKSEHQKRMNFAWLYVRDQILELIKSACKESTLGRCNGCLALAGLAEAVENFCLENKIDLDENCDPHASHRRWLSTAVESLLKLACDQQEYSIRSKTFLDEFEDKFSVVVSCLAFLSLSFISEQIFQTISIDSGKSINQLILDILQKKLTSTTTSLHHVQTYYLPFCFGLLQKSDSPEDHLRREVEILLRSSLIGRWFGLVSCLNRSKNETFHEEILSSMLDQGENLEIDTVEYSVACFAIANTISADVRRFETPIVSQILLNRAMKLTDKGSSSSFLPKSLMLTTVSEQNSNDQELKFVESWLGELKNPNILSIRKGDVFCALAAACGSEFCFVTDIVEFSTDSKNFQRKTCEILIEFCKNSLLSSDYDPLIIKPSLLSVAKLIYTTNYLNRNSVDLPKNYSYLNEKSTLRQCVEYLNGKSIDAQRARCILKIVSNCNEKPLPPLDWYSLIWPLREKFVAQFDEKSSISIAIDQKSIKLLSKFLIKSIFVELSDQLKMILAENIENLLKIVPNKRQILDIFSFDRVSNEKFYANLSGVVDNLDQNTIDVCYDFFVVILSEHKIDSYETFFRPNSLVFISVCTKLDEKRLEKVLGKVDYLTKFVYLSSKFVSKLENIETFNQLFEIFLENLTYIEKHSAMCIFAHLFHSKKLSVDSRQNLILQILNSSLISLNLKDFQKFDGYFNIFTCLINAFSQHSPQLPYFLGSAKVDGLEDQDADMVRLMSVRLPFAVLDCFSDEQAQFLSTKFVDWCVRVVTFDEGLSHVSSRQSVIDCLRVLCNQTRFKEVLKKSDVIDYLY